MKEIKKDTNKWKDMLCSWIGRLNTVKTSILPKEIYRFSAISMKISMVVFTDKAKNNPKIRTELKKTKSSQSDLEKEE